ncbi:SusC/RagA family TonB-linked outer membrane protein [Mucilaginibacter sp. Bleaf8]|uniref:SusC/RagA family TonB-linked outer membrane protein n=1 Tax=Mucilaginibacter sp. Bleaf8 TaxID=2834430 RepID=UPI001BCD2936|nr:SusC/RagA family TonB-linked outer membrane protein [Mucilaginibacter sp. Bleaf8]MBS7564374.1 SusC/RagA family TonB-linked outer membrane protein [Mucilaginibacter sp. Bleaf8]
MKKLLLVCLCILSLFTVDVFAQNRTVTGTVTAKEDGLTLPGVTVRVKNTTTGTQTDAKGHYSINAPAGATLVFSFIGYSTIELPASGATVNAVLTSSGATQLSEVTITSALGIKRQKKEIGFAATAVDNKTLNSGNAVNLANGLQGKVSGLNVTTTNSGVFENVKINLRGIRSLTGNNNPLLLLDGVQSDINYLSSLNPNDIEDVTVLKGAAAAGVYGSDARNGVIVVTTKKGSRNNQPVITVSNSTQFQKVSYFPKFQTMFGLGGGGTSAGLGDYTPTENWSWGPAYTGETIQYGPNYRRNGVELDPLTTTYSNKNDRQTFFNTGSVIQNNISYGDKNFYLSLQDANVNGIVPDDKNRRTGIRLNAQREYGRLKVDINTNYIQQNYNIFDAEGMGDYNSSQNIGLNQGLMNLLFNTGGYIPLKQFKDFENNPYAQYNNYYTDYGLNPYFAIDNWRKTGKRQDLITNLNLNFKVADWFNLNYRAGINAITIDERRFSRGETANQFGIDVRGFNSIPATLEERSYRYQRLSQEIFGNFNKQLNEDFKLTGILGFYVRQDDSRDTRVGATNLVVDNLYNISQRTGNLTGSSPGRRTRLAAYYGSASLSYKGWANVEVTGRQEQTSVLDLNNYSYFYPGVTGSLVLSDALPFLKDNKYVSYLKLRGAWSKTANADISPYQLTPTFTQSANGQTVGFPYGNLPGYTASNSQTVRNLKPEGIKNLEFGFEAGFLDSRINLEATYFRQNNTNQIIPINTSSAIGITSYTINAASFINKGVEMDLGLTPLVDIGKVHVNLKVNATYNTNKVTSVYGDLNEVSIGGYTYAGNYATVGYPAFVLRATDYLRDSEGRVIVDARTGTPSADPNTKIFGNTLPKWIVGITPNVRWKGLSVTANFEYKGGYYAYSDIGDAMAWTGVSQLSAVNNRERFIFPNSSILVNGQYVPNTNVTLNNPESFFTGTARSAASNYIISAAAWRLRELNIGYDLPAFLLKKQKVIKSANVAFTARNLFIWVPKSNMYGDPDFTFSPSASDFGNGGTTGVTTGNQAGISNSTINPPVRTFGGTITLTF